MRTIGLRSPPKKPETGKRRKPRGSEKGKGKTNDVG